MTSIREYLRDRQQKDREEYEQKIRAHRRKIRLRIGIAVLILAIAIVAINIYMNNKSFEGYSVTTTMEMNGTGGSRYYKFGKCLLIYSDDGISYTEDGVTIWNQAFEMKNPLVDICGDTMAIADMETTVVYIYDAKGQKGKIETVYPIIDLEVSAQGVVAAITQDDRTNRIEIFDRDGNSIAVGQTYVTGEGCPIDISLSEDGTKLVSSYIYVDGGLAKSRVVFYNYSEIGKNEVGRIVGGFEHYGTTIVSRVEFLDNDTVVAYGDNLFTVYSMKEKPAKVNEITFDNEIKSIFYNKSYIGAVLQAEDYDRPNIIRLYDNKGGEEMSLSTDFLYSDIVIGDDWLVMYNDTEMVMMTTSGRERYRGSISEGIRQIICTDRSNRYYIVNNERNIMNVTLK